jgi:hypothetical protein
MSVTHQFYIKVEKYSDVLIKLIKNKTNNDIIKLLNTQLKINNNLQWLSSSNSTWDVEILYNYIDWFMLFFYEINDNIYCGHMFERSISFYYFINNLKVFLTNGLLEHFHLNSHGTSLLPIDISEKLYNELK